MDEDRVAHRRAVTQERTPPELLGRVVSTTWTLALLGGPLAMLVAGAALELTGPGVVLAVMAGGLAVTVVYAAVEPGRRRIEPDDAAPA